MADDWITGRAALMREVRKPGKVFVTMIVRNGIHRVVAEKSDLLSFLEGEPEDDCSVAGFRQDDGSLVIDANYS